MTHMSVPLRLAALTLLSAVPQIAHADGSDISTIAVNLVVIFWPLWVGVGILVLVIAGFGLMVTSDEGRLQKARSAVIAVVIGGMLVTIIWVLGPSGFIGFMYTGGTAGLPAAGPTNIALEAMGVADWLTMLAAMIGMLFVIIAALRAVSSMGDEGKYTNARQALLHVILGLMLISAAYLFRQVFFYDGTPNALIAYMLSKVLIVLAFMTTIAVGILVYAGFRMVISFGKDDDFNNAKSLVIRVIMGLLVILLSYTLVIVVANIFTT